VDDDRRMLLWQAKLRVLVRRHWGVGGFDDDPRLAPGAMVAQRKELGWMLAEEDPGRALGRGLLWALRAGVSELHLIVSHPGDDAGRAARRAQRFHTRVVVWVVEDTDLVEVPPEPLPPEPALDPRAEPYVEVIVGAGAEPVVEWGALYGDVWGLEVARVRADAGDAGLEIGVGPQDRLLHQMMSEDEPSEAALTRVVDDVRRIRERGELAHPLNRLAQERWLRAWLVRNPAEVHAERLSPLAPPVARPDPRSPLPAPAVGWDAHGENMLVFCSVGFDTELVPMAAELHEAVAARSESPPRLVLALTRRHDHPLLRVLAADVVVPVEVARVPDDWRQRCRPEAKEQEFGRAHLR